MISGIYIEAMGTFFLALSIFLSGHPFGIGLMLMSMIYIGGHISGGYFNPAVTLSCVLYGSLPSITGAYYILAQLVGGGAAVGVCYLLTDSVITIPVQEHLSIMQAFLPEMLLTIVLCLSVLTMTTVHRYRYSNLAGLVIGLTLTALASMGGIFNPAVVVAGYIGDPIVYVLGPCIGGCVAAALYNIIEGKN